MKNKKGIETGLSDFYATIVIFLIILVFFFVLKFKIDSIQYSLTGEQLSLDATQLALVYAQSSVETSLGNMTYGEFISTVANDASLETEFTISTIAFFQSLEEKTHVAIVIVRDQKVKAFISPVPAFINIDTNPALLLLITGLIIDVGYNDATTVRVPLQNPNDYALIFVQTKSKD